MQIMPCVNCLVNRSQCGVNKVLDRFIKHLSAKRAVIWYMKEDLKLSAWQSFLLWFTPSDKLAHKYTEYLTKQYMHYMGEIIEWNPKWEKVNPERD